MADTEVKTDNAVERNVVLAATNDVERVEAPVTWKAVSFDSHLAITLARRRS